MSYGVLYFVSLYYVLFRSDVREKASYYLDRRFKKNSGLIRLLNCYRIYVNLGKALIDRATVGIKGPAAIRTSSKGLPELKHLITGERGLIMLTAHVGCWQAAMAELYCLNSPVSLLVHREEGDVDRHYFEHCGASVPFRIIDPMGYMGGVLEMMEILRRGEVVSIMGDRVFGSDRKTVAVEFLRGKVRFPFSAFKLSSATGAPIAVLFSYRNGSGTYEMSLEKVIEVPPDLGNSAESFYPYVEEYARALESYTERYPYQFFNFFNMWKSDANHKWQITNPKQ